MLRRPKRTLFVLATPRTGSTYFCQMIRQQAGVNIYEWFTQSRRPNPKKLTLDYAVAVSQIKAGQSSNRTFGCKIMAAHLRELLKILPYDRFPEVFGVVGFARCIRDDTAAQAVSWAKADMDNVWQKHRIDNRSCPKNYNLDELEANARKRMIDIRNDNRFLDEFIAKHNVPVAVTVQYENLLQDVNDGIRKIFSTCRIPAKQSDEVNQIILKRLRPSSNHPQ